MLERMLGVISKRAATRLSEPNISATVRHKKQKHEQEQDVVLMNISSIGLRFKSFDGYKIGEKLWFDIRSNEEKPLLSLSIRGKIVNYYGVGDDNLHNYGVRFYRFRFMNEIERINYYVHTHVELL